MIDRSFTAAAAVLILLLLSWCRLNDSTSHLSSSSSSSAASVTEATASVASSASSFSVEKSYVAQLVIVVSEGRSGSTELMDIINNIYDSRCISGKELFNPLHNGQLYYYIDYVICYVQLLPVTIITLNLRRVMMMMLFV